MTIVNAYNLFKTFLSAYWPFYSRLKFIFRNLHFLLRCSTEVVRSVPIIECVDKFERPWNLVGNFFVAHGNTKDQINRLDVQERTEIRSTLKSSRMKTYIQNLFPSSIGYPLYSVDFESGMLMQIYLHWLRYPGRHSVVGHSLWQRLKHGTTYRHMSHHLHRWRHSNAISRLNCSWDRTYVQVWYRLMLHVTFFTLLRALEVNIDLRHVNIIRYYYYYFFFLMLYLFIENKMFPLLLLLFFFFYYYYYYFFFFINFYFSKKHINKH